jgi:hypothetical protein
MLPPSSRCDSLLHQQAPPKHRYLSTKLHRVHIPQSHDRQVWKITRQCKNSILMPKIAAHDWTEQPYSYFFQYFVKLWLQLTCKAKWVLRLCIYNCHMLKYLLFLSQYQNIHYSRPCSTLYVVRVTLAIFGLHAGIMKFNIQNEEWISIHVHIILPVNFSVCHVQ